MDELQKLRAERDLLRAALQDILTGAEVFLAPPALNTTLRNFAAEVKSVAEKALKS